jgi:copper chaperone CopZ
MTTTLTSGAIRCGGCANNVKAVLGKLPGVRTVAVDPATKRITVDFDDAAVTTDSIRDRLAQAGYPADASA